jgi:hypothetical protein
MYVALERLAGRSGVGGVFSIDPSGHAERFAAAIASAWNVAIDACGLFDGELYLSGKLALNDPAYTMWRADTAGGISEFAVATIGNHLLAFVFGPDGALYVPEYSREELMVVINRIVPVAGREVAVDIKPGSCPNPLNLGSRGKLPVAILGSEELDVAEIDVATVKLAGIDAVRSGYEDVATPVGEGNECDCTEDGPDGYLDLTLKFKTADVAEELMNTVGEVNEGEFLVLPVTASLFDGTPIEGEDCVRVAGKSPRALAAKKADVDGNGIVNIFDYAVIASYWLEYTVVDY